MRTNRRQALGVLAAPVLLGLLPRFAKAEGEPPVCPAPEVTVEADISSNHRHELLLTIKSLLELLRESATRPEGIALDIQGGSGHGHLVTLTHEQLLELLVTGSLAKESSLEFGHSHLVTIQVLLQ